MQIGRPLRGLLELVDVRALEYQALPLTPWEVDPYRLWSLWDMIIFYNASFVAAWGEFTSVCRWVSHEPDEFIAELSRTVAGLEQEVIRSKLPVSHGTKDHFRLIKMDLNAPSPNISTLLADARSIHNSLLHDLGSHAFVRIPPHRKDLYRQKQPPFGDTVAAKFPDSVRDVEAAGRCLALGEWTACVFHLMRALEQPLHTLAAKLNIIFPKPMDFQNWKTIIDKIDAEITKEAKMLEQKSASHERATTLQFYGDAALQLRHFKNAWRNNAMHAREHYDEREADRVYDAVKEFMQTLVAAI